MINFHINISYFEFRHWNIFDVNDFFTISQIFIWKITRKISFPTELLQISFQNTLKCVGRIMSSNIRQAGVEIGNNV